MGGPVGVMTAKRETVRGRAGTPGGVARRARLAIVATLAVGAALLGGASTAKAVPTMTVDIKAHYSAFVAGSTIDLPVYFVENRAAIDQSWIGAGRLYAVKWDFGTNGAQFISFTPVAGFNQIIFNQVGQDGPTSRMWASMQSTAGIGVTVDNSGINGRTEVRIGTLRVKVGPAIRHAKQWIVFDMGVNVDPSWGAKIPARLLPTGGVENHTTMATRQIRYYASELPRETLAKCRKARNALKKVRSKAKRAKQQAKRARKKANKAAPPKKAKLKKKAKKAKSKVKKLNKKVNQAKKKVKKTC